MGDLIFFNIGWMGRYRGLDRQPDKIVGGGWWVKANERGHEVCNFLPADDGYVYGHVETIWGEKDRQIKLENSFNCSSNADSVTGVSIVWTATDPTKGGRRVVGWYKNATIFRQRQQFERSPSRQHKLDSISNYRAFAKAQDCYCLPTDERTLQLGRGAGWMGQASWWTPQENAARNIRAFVAAVRQLLDSPPSMHRSVSADNTPPNKLGRGANSPSASTKAYTRYMQAYEIQIPPEHDKLQKNFVKAIEKIGARNITENKSRVDLRYNDHKRGQILAEIKPCDSTNARFAIRTAIGQLLDYDHVLKTSASKLIVLGAKPNEVDIDLAIHNGFGVAYPKKNGFDIIWP